MKMIQLNGKDYSKIICGSNPFYGHSHFSEARNQEYLERFTDDYLEQMIRFCMDKGVNTFESCANERITNILKKVNKNRNLNFIGTTRIDETSEMKSHQQKLNYLIEQKADICVIHSQFVDRPGTDKEIKGLSRFIEKIHENGLLAGISTHRVSTVELCENNDYGIDVYLFPLNQTGYVYPGYDGKETVAERLELIHKVDKPFVIMKSLASGRTPPGEGLKFVLDNIKENDMISLGLGSIEEATESLEIIQEYFNTAA